MTQSGADGPEIDYDERRRRLTGTTRTITIAGEEFKAKPLMPGQWTSELGDLQDGGHTWERTAKVIEQSLIPSERQRFRDFLEIELDVPITLDELMIYATKLLEADTGRPTPQPSPSGATGESTTTRSMDGNGSTAGAASMISPSGVS